MRRHGGSPETPAKMFGWSSGRLEFHDFRAEKVLAGQFNT